MRFAAEIWLWGVLLAAGLGVILIAQAVRLTRDRARFGDAQLVLQLLTAKTGTRRAIRGTLACLAVAFAFVAAAQPQYGKGTRILPATNLDVVVVLDYSKSMYAQDVSPSRIGRAKVEVTRLIRELSGARFAAVAFAGESISFPLTSDGSAISQFFRGIEPNDLPVGGTAIARALESGRQLLARDPLSKNHEKVMILVTDGEDLEGDPVAVAEAAHKEGIRVDVVQIGGSSPEPIPLVDENGMVRGMRKSASGQIMTTQLSPEGEAQLASVARVGGGQLVSAEAGKVGLDEMTVSLRRMMTEELSERVETVFADVFQYPLVLAVLLLSIEVWIGTAPAQSPRKDPPKGQGHRRQPRRLKRSAILLCLLSLGCQQSDRLFERESPVVNEAIAALAAKNPHQAIEDLVEYLETGPCEAGVIGAGDKARRRGDASLDLALAFSQLSGAPPKAQADDPAAALAQGKLPPLGPTPPAPGTLGAPLGSEPPAGPDAEAQQTIECALRVLAPIAANTDHSIDLRARAHYLSGNLELSRGEYESAVAAYDAALLLAPGVKEGAGDPVGVSIAYNRALSLRLLQEKKKQEEEQKKEQEEQDKQQEEEPNEENQDDSEKQPGDDKDPKEEPEQEKDPQEEEESGDQGQDEQPQNSPQDPEEEQSQDKSEPEQQPQDPSADQKGEEREEQASQAQQGPSEARDQQMLDLLEQAPTLQQHDAQKRRDEGVRVRSTMEDK